MHEIGAHHTFQYATPEAQSVAAQDGMWLFLATEVLFFGGLFLVFLVSRHQQPRGFALAAEHANLLIGGINTGILVTSSFALTTGLLMTLAGRPRLLFPACLATACLGVAFLVLKGIEWKLDFDEHLFPGPGFGLTGPDAGGAQLFYAFYFVATALHGVHMLVGVFFVGRLGLQARAGRFDDGWATPAEVVGLYWSFVDMVWLVLFPLIYLVGRA